MTLTEQDRVFLRTIRVSADDAPVVTYPPSELTTAAATCPNCKTPTFIPGKGSQITAHCFTVGTYNPATGGHDGAVSEYTCRVCRHVWRVTFPDGAVFQG